MDIFTGFMLVTFGVVIGAPAGWHLRGWFREEVTPEHIAAVRALKDRANKMDPIPGSGKTGEEGS